MALLGPAGRNAEDRGDHVPAQAYLLGPVQQVGLKPVEIKPQIAEHDEARPEIKRISGAAIAGRVEHRRGRPEIVNQVRRQLAWIPAGRREPSRQPVPGTFQDTLVRARGLVGPDRVTHRVQGRKAVGDVCEHAELLLPQMTEVAALLDYVRGRTKRLESINAAPGPVKLLSALVGRKPLSLERRVAEAAETALTRQKFVAAVDVLAGLRWLAGAQIDTWRQGRVSDLSTLLPVPDERLAQAVAYLQGWAAGQGLVPSEATYVAASRDRRPLRFTSAGDPVLERACRTHWVAADLPEPQRERLAERQRKPPDLVVVRAVKDWTCAGCGAEDGGLLIMDSTGPQCLTCADLDHLEFLPSGDAALTRRAKKASGLSAVVVQWSRTRKRYERQGILVEETALEQAERECLADEAARARRRERDTERRASEDVLFQARMAQEIVRLFPGCPAERAAAIARHAGLRGSGRVGRSAAGRALGENAVTLAVVASVRHEDTGYDALLMSGIPREVARDKVRAAIERVLESWAAGQPSRGDGPLP